MATEENTAPKKTRAKQKPRPLFVVYKGVDVEILSATRNSSEVLELVDKDRDLKFTRITV